MEIPGEQITGIVLSGGKARRMGREKGLLTFHGKSLVEHSIDLLQPFCNEIIISANHPGYQKLGHKVVPDHFPAIGPLGGLYSALVASRSDINLVVACDMPLLRAGLIRMLLQHAGQYDAVVPEFNGLPEPVCAVYRKRIAGTLEACIQKKVYKLQDVIDGMQVRMVEIRPGMECYRPDLFMNINTPEQLSFLEGRMSG